MKSLPCFLLATSLLFANCAFADEKQDATEARSAAERWIKLMDGEEYSAAWNTGAESVRKGMPKFAWTMLNSTLHAPLGAFRSRTFQSSSLEAASTGKPAAVTLSYLADYENSHKVLEKYTAVRERDGVWRVTGYTIHSEDSKTGK